MSSAAHFLIVDKTLRNLFSILSLSQNHFFQKLSNYSKYMKLKWNKRLHLPSMIMEVWSDEVSWADGLAYLVLQVWGEEKMSWRCHQGLWWLKGWQWRTIHWIQSFLYVQALYDCLVIVWKQEQNWMTDAQIWHFYFTHVCFLAGSLICCFFSLICFF